MIRFLLWFSLIFLNIFSQRVSSDVIVNTNVGQIRGYRATDGDYNMFMGIPYAVVNSSNPFGESVAVPTFDGIFDANDDSSICPQIEEFNNTLAGSLDCLDINLYVPNTINVNEQLPVLVWFYGGGFSIGFGGRFLYGPSYFMKQNIIIATVNYRLGPYGFMCLDIPEVPGNQGLKDQTLGLRWIKNNIESFGGDPNSITVFGNSAGGMSIDLHLMSEQEQLFQRAIIQSGTSFTPAFSKPDPTAPIVLANHFGLQTNDIYEAIALLATVEPLQIIQAVNDLQLSFSPCVEKKIAGVEHFITFDWLGKEMPKVENMDVLIGFTNDEWILRYAVIAEESFGNLNLFNNRLVGLFDAVHEDFEGMIDVMRHFYVGDEELNIDMMQQLADFDSDLMMIYPSHMSLRRYLDNGVNRCYIFQFSYVGERNFVRHRLGLQNVSGGANHADEVGYLFDVSYMPPANEADQAVIDRITTLWANFVKYGDPTPELSTVLPVKWLPITNGSQYHYLDINSELTVGTRPYHDRMAFWDLFYKANGHLKIVYPFGVTPESIDDSGLDETESGDSESSGISIAVNIFIIALCSAVLNLLN